MHRWKKGYAKLVNHSLKLKAKLISKMCQAYFIQRNVVCCHQVTLLSRF
jgi:hypothetical protein